MDAAFAWALAATLMAGVQVFVQKIVAHEGRDSALNGIFGYGLSGVGAAAIFFLFYDLPELWLPILLIASVSGTVHAVGSYVRIESLKFIDTVIYFPINKVLGPILVVITGVWWFGEILTLTQYLGIAFSITVPLLLVSSSEHHRQRNLRLGLVLLVISTVLTSLTSPFMKASLNLDETLFFSMLVGQFTGTFASIVLYAYLKRKERQYFSLHARDIELGVITGFLQFVSFYAFLMALSMGYLSIVYVIHAHYILVPIILSVWWYREHINMRKFAAIVVSSAAITLLGL